MTQSTQRKKSSSTRSNTKTSSKSVGGKTSRTGTPAKVPRRREIMAAVSFILAAFTFISYFNADGAFIGLFTGLARGLVGRGFFYLAPALLLCAIILTFHRGRPVVFRALSSLLLCVLAGALTHLFSRPAGYSFEVSFARFPVLWQSGLDLVSGGALSGSLADLLGWAFGRAGAGVLLIVATVFFLLAALNRSISSVVEVIKNRPRIEYVPEPEPENMPESRQTVVQIRAPLPRRKKAIDIPIDPTDVADADIPRIAEKPKRDSLFNNAPRVRTPDQLISEYVPEEPGVASLKPESGGVSSADNADSEIMSDEAVINIDNSHAEQPEADEDLPLDIPFMERRRVQNAGKQSTVRELESDVFKLDPNGDGVDGGENPDETAQNSHAYTPSHDNAQTEPQRSTNAAATTQSVEQAASTRQSDTAPKPGANQSNQADKNETKIESELLQPFSQHPDSTYKFPPIDLLEKGKGNVSTDDSEVRLNSERLESAFKSFGVNVIISNATRGPSVTRYEATLEAGIKLSKLTNLADDIALTLGTSGVRIAVVPNMAKTVGIEVPNKTISTVYLRDIIESHNFRSAKSKLTFAIGTNISGESIVGNVSKMPHMLVAGTTGSGKSVCLNSIILSILYKASPEDVRFVMIDPKMVEFKIYNEIPHMHVPVVTDCKKASGALQWAVFEMEKRYKLFSETSARELDGYNVIAKDDETREVLPRVVVVIDELADLMMTAAKEVEESICRVAQKGRAAGMHLIIATQSPRADVITGLMKANIPSRIAMKVSSALESRIILDAGGNADKLVGNGDMLFAPIGADKPMRVQGTWVSDEEREAVVEFLKSGGETHYSEEVMEEIEKAAAEKGTGEKAKEESDASDHDELLPQAVDVIFETNQASVSMLQRKLKLGYSRAARIVDQMESMGILGPFEGSKPRQLLITKEQWRQMQYIEGTAPEELLPEPTPAPEEE